MRYALAVRRKVRGLRVEHWAPREVPKPGQQCGALDRLRRALADEKRERR